MESRSNSLHQYRLMDDGYGKIRGVHVRTFGENALRDKVKGLVADDELGFVYVADEGVAIRKYYADPDRGDNNEIAAFGFDDGISIPDDRGGLAICRCDSKTGYLLVSSRNGKAFEEFSSVKVYRREGNNGNPHEHSLVLTINTMGSAETDGLDVTGRPVSPDFSHGFLVKHDSQERNFKLYSWDDIVKSYSEICSGKAASHK